MPTKKKSTGRSKIVKLARPSPLSAKDKKDLSRILKKARAFKAFYAQGG